MNILELNSVNKSYDGRCIITNLSFSVEERSIISIIGKSGAGKSTVLNMIGLLETVDSGTIKIKKEKIPPINSQKATMLRRNTINYLFQSHALISDMTVKDNLKIAMEFMDLSKKEKDNLIHKALKDLKIEHLINKKVNTLSGDEQQRVALARCILKPGDLILADEPTGSLDDSMAITVFELIKKLRDDYGKTIIIVTHDMNLAKQTDKIIEISNL